MKVIFCLAALVAVTLAAPQSSKDAQILKYESDNIGVEGYKFNFETSDQLSRVEEGVLKNVGSENEALAVHGIISWVDHEGTPFHLEFTADENGFQPIGAHIPK